MTGLDENTFGRRQGADVYMELVMSYPSLMDERVINIAHQAAQIAIDAHTPHPDHLVPARVAKAIVDEIEDMTFERGRFSINETE
jgi:hypothetical protein